MRIDNTLAASRAPELLPSLLLAPDANAEEELWYRDNDTRTAWEPLNNLPQAKDIIRARTPQNPWAAIMRTFDLDDAGTFGSVNTFEVLGWADRVYVCGDVSRVGYQWRWSCWPVTARPDGGARTRVGPRWYQADVYEAQVVTVNDAIAQLVPALHALPEVPNQAPGFLWLPRELDVALNQHLRTPIDG
ncbi:MULTISPECIES: hypothetical protein [unclassified Curtobacterium]|jgi:hypothetical protein|uniref:hypothetical protein n=1 Tax=unclassified Curtobacterium TaxID=257496 RepID=UPI0010E6F52D|nr:MULTISPECIES: hypothetical protein [unclassified Curtobacterium]TCL79015.1 hypothetical protein EDF23_10384 [Curtobacterium sp. PhB128]TCL97513.1 hypothetical protein EDF29_103300 [Curtobacterium sp. PhB138]